MCESCFAMYEPAAVCPQCGHVNKVRDTTPKQVEGTLTEITAENLIRKEKRTEQGQAESLEDLKRIAKERGYKTGWANAIYTSRQKKIEKVEAERIKKEEFKNLPEIELQKFTINNFDDDLDF